MDNPNIQRAIEEAEERLERAIISDALYQQLRKDAEKREQEAKKDVRLPRRVDGRPFRKPPDYNVPPGV